MATLTQAQRTAKSNREKAARSAKKAAAAIVPTIQVEDLSDESLGPVVNEDGTPTATTVEMLTGVAPVEAPAPEPEPLSLHDQILKLGKRTQVEAPRGGVATIIVQKYRNDGSRLLTSDGRQIKRDAACTHELEQGYAGVFYEIVGGRFDGEHGWIHRARGCNRPYATA